MDQILTDFSKSAIIAAIENNPAEANAYISRIMKWELYDGPDMLRIISGIPYMMGNYVFRAKFTSETLDNQITKALAPFQARQLPMLWYTGPSTRPADLGTYLEAHGLSLYSHGAGMAADLLTLNEEIHAPSNFTIERVVDIESSKNWFHPFSTVYELPDFATKAMHDFIDTMGFDSHLPMQRFVGFLDGEPVACSALGLAAGVAGIFSVATVPEARRRGIGSAITMAALREARERGYRISVLEAFTPNVEEMYRRMGFKEYCQYGIYAYIPGNPGLDNDVSP